MLFESTYIYPWNQGLDINAVPFACCEFQPEDKFLLQQDMEAVHKLILRVCNFMKMCHPKFTSILQMLRNTVNHEIWYLCSASYCVSLEVASTWYVLWEFCIHYLDTLKCKIVLMCLFISADVQLLSREGAVGFLGMIPHVLPTSTIGWVSVSSGVLGFRPRRLSTWRRWGWRVYTTDSAVSLDFSFSFSTRVDIRAGVGLASVFSFCAVLLEWKFIT